METKKVRTIRGVLVTTAPAAYEWLKTLGAIRSGECATIRDRGHAQRGMPVP